MANTVPCSRSRVDQPHQEAWMPDFACVVTPVGPIRYQDNDVEVIIPYPPQKGIRQASYRPPRIQRHGLVVRPFLDTRQPSLSSSRSSPSAVYYSNSRPTSPPSQATPHHPTLSANTKTQPEKKYWCCGRGFSQMQALRRHIKDSQPKLTCPHCRSFTWSRGRRYLYRRHLYSQHPKMIDPSEVRQRVQHTPRRP